MSADGAVNLILLLVAVGVALYLLSALIFPERF